MAGPVANGKIRPPVGGVYTIKHDGQTWYLAQQGSWAFFATSRRGLADAPADPVKTFAGLNAQYDFAARLMLQNLPEEVRQVARRWRAEGHQLLLDREAGESALHRCPPWSRIATHC